MSSDANLADGGNQTPIGDPEVAARFEEWLNVPSRGLRNARIAGFKWSGGGWSSRNYFIEVSTDDGPLQLVTRCGPSDLSRSVFPEYDLERQFRVIQALDQKTEVPVTPARWFEPSPSVFGGPFFVMDEVAGDIPGDDPPFQTAGFLFEATPDQRRLAWRSAVARIAQLGSIDVNQAGLTFLASGDGRRNIEQQLDYYEALFRSGRSASGPFPIAERALSWLREHAAEPDRPGFVWGDARVGNMIFRNFEVAALLDWETACLGDPVIDLANMLLMQACHEDYMVPELSRPRLEGFSTDAETIAYYEELTGRQAKSFHYAMTFCAYKNLALLQRFVEVAAMRGVIAQADKEHIKENSFPFVGILEQNLG